MDVPDESPGELFQRALKVPPSLGQQLVDGGLTSLEEVAYVPFVELARITGLQDHELTALRRVARLYLENRDLGDGSEGWG